MTNVEQLLRDTLNDPRRRLEPGGDIVPAVLTAARHRQRARAIVSAASCAVLLVVVGGVVALNHHSRGRTVTPVAPNAAVETQIDLGSADFHVGAVIASHTSVFVFVESTPTKVLQLNATTSQLTRAVDGPAGANGGLAIDANGRDLFAWTADGSVRQYNAKTMATVHSVANVVPAGVSVFDGAVLDGQLWLTSDQGLFVVSFDGNSAQVAEVANLTNVYALTADPARHRMLVGAYGGGGFTTQIVAVDGATHALTRGGGLPVGKESIVVVGDEVWVGGYGDETASRLLQLDTQTLQRKGSPSAVNADLGPGAMLWAGQHVLWVRSGGSELLTCVDPTTGEALQTWDAVQGPVTSVSGSAYASDNGLLQKLTLNPACKG